MLASAAAATMLSSDISGVREWSKRVHLGFLSMSVM
uniref:Predicted protein n=1 Tax=Hordeum vulgare subsp. vulgare TaxID=112509 RepID=F2DCE5_HORVV|nr:predicted protein [Hordeum vulgare subsp. vulgare]